MKKTLMDIVYRQLQVLVKNIIIILKLMKINQELIKIIKLSIPNYIFMKN